MSSTSDNPSEAARTDLAGAETRGITRVPVDYFHYKSFRYTNLADAVAETDRETLRNKAGHDDG